MARLSKESFHVARGVMWHGLFYTTFEVLRLTRPFSLLTPSSESENEISNTANEFSVDYT